jgi:hypothetical protein
MITFVETWELLSGAAMAGVCEEVLVAVVVDDEVDVDVVMVVCVGFRTS